MPIPTPNKNESQDDFISRCMANDTMVDEYEQKQRAAICYNQWRKKHPEDKKKARIETLTQEELKGINDDDLRMLRQRFLQQWDKNFAFNDAQKTKGLSRRDFLSKYSLVAKEL